MTQKEKMVAVFMEQEEVLHVFPDWPQDMRLIVCMEQNGDVQLLIYRQEERGAFPARLLKNLELRRDELCVHPPVVGYPSRQILYTEECGLGSLIADAPEIVERALDYSMNYSYALEEGLDPARFVDNDEAEDVQEDAAEVPLQFVRRGYKPAETVDQAIEKYLRPGPSAEPSQGLASSEPTASVLAQDETVQEEIEAPTIKAAADPIDFYDVQRFTDDWVTLERRKKGGFDLLVIDQEQIEWREDQKLLALQVTSNWQKQSGLPKRVRIYLDQMPPAVARALRENDGKAGVTSDGAFLYLKLSKKPQPIVREVAQAKTKVDTKPAEMAVKKIKPLAAPKRPLVAPKRNVAVQELVATKGSKTHSRVGYAGAALLLVAAVLTFGYLQLSNSSVASVKNTKPMPGWYQGIDARGSGHMG